MFVREVPKGPPKLLETIAIFWTVIPPSWQIATGASVSLTVTSKLQVAVLPFASVTIKVFVVVPTLKVLPLGKPAVCSTPPFNSKTYRLDAPTPKSFQKPLALVNNSV